jgi:hypothetical protein
MVTTIRDANQAFKAFTYAYNDLIIVIFTHKLLRFFCEYSILALQWGAVFTCFFSVMTNNVILRVTGNILNWTTTVYPNNPRRRVITDRETNENYLERYYLFLKDRQQFPFNIFLHKFCKSDPADLHDHPWDFAHLIVRGGYWETVAINNDPKNTTRIWRAPGYFNYVTSKHTHKVELDPNEPLPITLFFPFKRSEVWGFYKVETNQDVKHVKYLDHELYFKLKKTKIED